MYKDRFSPSCTRMLILLFWACVAAAAGAVAFMTPEELQDLRMGLHPNPVDLDPIVIPSSGPTNETEASTAVQRLTGGEMKAQAIALLAQNKNWKHLMLPR